MDNREQQILHSWDANASAWNDSIRLEQIESRKVATNKAMVDAIIEIHPRTVLDVGCGEGWLVRELCKFGIDATGFDGSKALIETANKTGIGKYHTLTYTQVAESNPIKQEKYDAIICNFALIGESIVDLLTALKNLLSDEGKLFIQTLHPFAACGDNPYKNDWRIETFSNFGSNYKEPMPWYFRTAGSWLNVITQAGLKIVECKEPIHPSTGKPLSLLLVCSRESK